MATKNLMKERLIRFMTKKQRILLSIITFTVIFISLMFMTGELKIKKTTTITKDVGYYLKEDGYQKHNYYDLYAKEYNSFVSDEFQSIIVNFDFGINHYIMQSEERIVDQWTELVLISYSFESNVYNLSYVKKTDEIRLYTLYTYQPDVSSKIELTYADFEGDYYAEIDEEKYMLFNELHDNFEEELGNLNLSVDDLLEWSATLD
jgi:hypothetical protein